MSYISCPANCYIIFVSCNLVLQFQLHILHLHLPLDFNCPSFLGPSISVNPSLPAQEQHFLHFLLPPYTYSNHMLYWFYAKPNSIFFFFSIASATSSFHHHVSLFFGGPFVHSHTCSAAFCNASFIAFHLLSTLAVSNTVFQPWCVHFLFLPSCTFNDTITHK